MAHPIHEMHARHHAEKRAMHTRHEAEMKAMHARHANELGVPGETEDEGKEPKTEGGADKNPKKDEGTKPTGGV